MIVRAKRKTNFTIISNVGMNDERLSLKAKGMLAYLLTKPDNWQVSDRHLATIGPDGRSAVQAALKELETFGYLVRKRARNEQGQWSYVSYIYDEPWSEKPWTENPATVNPSTENPAKVSTEVVSTEVTKRERPLPTPRRASLVAQEKTATAGELGIAPALLTTLTNTVLDLTGMRALADAGDDFKLRDAQDAAIHLARMGYGSTDLLKDLGDAWKMANQWRNGSRPTIRNLKEFASQQAATGNTASTNGQWGAISDSVPDYMKG